MARSEQSYRAARKAAVKAKKLSWRRVPAYWVSSSEYNRFKQDHPKPTMLLKVPSR